jgi:integrase
MTPENCRSAAGPDRPRQGTPTRALVVGLGTTRPPRPARRSPPGRGGRHSPTREPAPNLVARLRPGHGRTAGYGIPGPPLNLPNPLGLATPLTRQVRFQSGQEFCRNPGPLIRRELEGFPEHAIGTPSHARILLYDWLDEQSGRAMGVRPPKHATLPTTLRWDAVQEVLSRCRSRRDRAIVALMAYGGLRRSELVALNIGDVDPGFGLRRVHGKGGQEATVLLPTPARAIVSDYLQADRPDAPASDPLFLVSYPTVAHRTIVKRMPSSRVWKLVHDLGERSGIKALHPHALRHACAVELRRRTRNLRAVQQHLRHCNIQSTTVYARLMPHELAEAVSAFDA